MVSVKSIRLDHYYGMVDPREESYDFHTISCDIFETEMCPACRGAGCDRCCNGSVDGNKPCSCGQPYKKG